MLSAAALRRSALHFELGQGGGWSADEARKWLFGENQLQVVQQQRQVGFRLCVARHHQVATVGRGQPDVERLHCREFLQHGSGTQAGSVCLQPMLQRRLQTVRQKGDQDMRRGCKIFCVNVLRNN